MLNNHFNEDVLAMSVFNSKYKLDNEETPDGMHWRIAKEFYRVRKYYTLDYIYNLYKDFKYLVGGGSVLYGVGNNKQLISLSNCFVVDSPLDSYSSIIKTDEAIVNISKRRGGVGLCLDNLRPRGSITRNAAKTSSGIIPFMERFSNTIKEVGQSGRRGAEMQLISVHHPEILEFINAKSEDGKISGANISVKLTDEFLNAVKNNTTYEQRFPVDPAKERMFSSYKYNAIEIWNHIIHAAWNMAEPGILFWDNVLNNGPAECYPRFRAIATNPCGELPLSAFDSCRLQALNLFSFVINPFTPDAKFDFDLFDEKVYAAQKMMDCLVDLESEKIQAILNKINNDPEPDYIKVDEYRIWSTIKANNDEGRRCGLGVLGLADMFAALNIGYATDEAIAFADKVFRCFKLAAYRSSVDMAKELGSFKGYDPKLEENSPFIKRLADEDPALYADMVKYGRRNVGITTIAPTGSISLLARTSSGIEPVFALSHTRKKKVQDGEEYDTQDKEGFKWKNYDILHPGLALWTEITGNTDISQSPYYNYTSDKIDWINRVKLQGVIQKHICASISSTVNLPNDVNEQTVAEIYNQAWINGLKGITVYRDGCREGVLVKEADKQDTVRSAIKRPKALACDVYHINVNKKLDKVRTFSYMVALGLLNDKPYEIFVLENGKYNKKASTGIITKLAQGLYNLTLDTGEIIENITADNTDEEDSLTRMVSLLLRHNVPVNYIMEQLSKVKGEMFCFAKSISRSLKKYIKDGTKSGESCNICGTKLIYENGCFICKNCGNSKCN